MRPLNTQERSKMVWQFLLIVFLLCFVPIAIVFWGYYEAPREIDREDQEKLANYTKFEHDQRLLMKQMSDIDASIVAMNNGSNVNISISEANVPKAIANLTSMSTDTASIVKSISKAFTDYYLDADKLYKTSADNKTANAALLKAQSDYKDLKAQSDKNDIINAMHK